MNDAEESEMDAANETKNNNNKSECTAHINIGSHMKIFIRVENERKRNGKEQ